MGLVVQVVDFLFRRRPSSVEDGERTKCDERDRQLTIGVRFHHRFRIVAVTFDDETSLGGEGQKPQHVATRQAGDEGFLRIHC